MNIRSILAIVVIVAILAAGVYLTAGEKKADPAGGDKEQALEKKNTDAGQTEDTDKAAPEEGARESGRIEIWVNGKKVLEKSYKSDGSEEGREKDEFEDAIKKFMKRRLPGEVEEKEKDEPKVSRIDADVKVITTDGKHTLFVNRKKIKAVEAADGSISLTLKVDKDGKAKFMVNGEEKKLPASKRIVLRGRNLAPLHRWNWDDFDFDFDLQPLRRPFKRFRGFEFQDRDFDDFFKEFDRLHRDFFKRFFEDDRGRLRREKGEGEDSKDTEEDEKPEKKLVPRPRKSENEFR